MHLRLTAALFLAALLTLIGCGDGTGSAGDTPSPAGSPTGPAASPSVTPDGEFAEATRCDSPEGYSVSYPASWHTNTGEVVPECGQFAPEPFEVPAGTDERVAPVTIFIDPVEFFRAASPDSETSTELSRATTVIDGRQAVRLEQESTGEGLYPAGVEQTIYVVDLAIGTDDTDPGTLFMTTVDLTEFDYSQSVAVMDRMARTMRITAGDQPEEENAVARFEGGAGGFTLVAEATQGQTCLRIPPGGQPACLDNPGSDGVAATQLTLIGPETVLGGLAGPDVFRVDAHQSDGDVLSVLPAGISGTGVRGWAPGGDGSGVTDLRWFDIEGNELGRSTL